MIERDPLLVERERTHGPFSTNSSVSQHLKDVIRENRPGWSNLTAEQREAIDLIFLKIGRIIGNPKYRDHWDDIAGYAKLGSEACE